MNNIWIPAYKILANTVFLDITSFTYDLDSIKLVLTDDNNKKDIEHFLIRLSDGLFNIVCRKENFKMDNIFM